MSADSRPNAATVLGVAYLAGSIPFSGMLARVLRGVDLRTTGTGTVSGTGLYRVAGLGPLLAGGLLDVAKGTVGPALAGSDRPGLAAAAGAAAVTGHNWSPFLRGAGGRGISPAMGSLLVNGWPGSVHLLIALAVGKLSKATSLGAFAGFITLPAVMARARGGRGLVAAFGLLGPMLVKRVTGNTPLPRDESRTRLAATRLFFDQDTPAWPWWWPGART
jgi:glycerol-3-phosphate acyltransferase PlsY